LFIVNPLIVQLFILDCSLVFINERIFLTDFAEIQANQWVEKSGTPFAFQLRSLDSKNKKAEPCH